jgi:hypothetical protein
MFRKVFFEGQLNGGLMTFKHYQKKHTWDSGRSLKSYDDTQQLEDSKHMEM